jgi:hypothetical protein
MIHSNAENRRFHFSQTSGIWFASDEIAGAEAAISGQMMREAPATA